MLRARISLTSQFSPGTSRWRAGNIARSRLSGGSCSVSARPGKLVWRGGQPCFDWILLDVSPNAIEFRAGSNQAVKALFLPKWSVGAQENIGLVGSKAFQRAQPLGREDVRGRQKMNMIRHHHESMQLIPMQFPVSVPQRRYDHPRNFRAAQKGWASGGCVQETVHGNERLARRYDCARREYAIVGETAVQSERYEQGLFDYIPVG